MHTPGEAFENEALTVGRRPRVLVVDDDDDVRALIVAIMECDGYEVSEARDGGEAVHFISGSRRFPDAIVTDVRMPNVSGLSLLAGLRKEGCMTPIVITTAYGVDRVRQIAERLGADAVFAKPLDIERLRTVVMNVMRPNGGPRAVANTEPDA